MTTEPEALWPVAPARPQLVMRRLFEARPPTPLSLAPGYLLRTARPDEAADLAHVLKNAFPEMEWTSQKVREVLIDASDVTETFVATWDGRLVGTASVRRLPTLFPEAGIVHWVAVHEEHRGKRLGRALTERVCEEIGADGFGTAFLETDDHRLPAISTYLSLGFEPYYSAESHHERWVAVMRQIKSGRGRRQ